MRYQDDVLTKNEVADYLQACGSAVLVVRAAAEHEKKSRWNFTIILKQSIHNSIIFVAAMVQWRICSITKLLTTQALRGMRWWVEHHSEFDKI